MTHRRNILLIGLGALALATTGCPGGSNELPKQNPAPVQEKTAKAEHSTSAAAEEPEVPTAKAPAPKSPAVPAPAATPKPDVAPVQSPIVAAPEVAKPSEPTFHHRWTKLKNGHPVMHVFDERGRLVGIAGKGYERIFLYDERDLLREHRNCDGRIEMFGYDRSRRLVRWIGPAGSAAYERDKAGRLVRVVTPGDRTWIFKHDGERVVEEDGATGLIRHDYDAQGLTKRVRDASGRAKLFNRGKDAKGSWVDLTTASGETIQQRFDAKGRLRKVETEGHVLRYRRGKDGFSIQSPQATLRFAIGEQAITIGTPWGSFVRERNDAGVPTAIVAPGNQTFRFRLDGRGRRVGIVYPNGTATLQRDFMSRLVKVTHPAFRYEAHYSKQHEQDRRVEHGVETRIEHDEVGRIATIARGGKVVRRFGYDRDSNRVLDVQGSKKRTAVFDKRFRITRYGKDTFEHDAAGRLTKRVHAGGTDTFRYDGFGRLVEVARAGSPVVRYGYSGQNRIVRRTVGKQTTHFVWEGSKLLAEVGPGKRVRLYADGNDFAAPLAYLENGRWTYLHADHRGTVLAYSDANGKQVARATYGLFGELTNVPTDRPLFYGAHWVDPIARVIPMRARVYEPTLGRFLTPDPSGLDGGLNPYVYGDNDPVDHVDPQGLKSELPDELAFRSGAQLEEKLQAALVEELLKRNAAKVAALQIKDAKKRAKALANLPDSKLQRLYDFKQAVTHFNRTQPKTGQSKEEHAEEALEALKSVVEAAPLDPRLKKALTGGLDGIEKLKEAKEFAQNLRKTFFPSSEERKQRANPFKRFAALMKAVKPFADKAPVIGEYLGFAADAVIQMEANVDTIAARADLTEAAIRSVRQDNTQVSPLFRRLKTKVEERLEVPDPATIVENVMAKKLERLQAIAMARAPTGELIGANAMIKRSDEALLHNLGLLGKHMPESLESYAKLAKKLSESSRVTQRDLAARYASRNRVREYFKKLYEPLAQDGELLLRDQGYDLRAKANQARQAVKRLPNPVQLRPAKPLDVSLAVVAAKKPTKPTKQTGRSRWKVGKKKGGARSVLESSFR